MVGFPANNGGDFLDKGRKYTGTAEFTYDANGNLTKDVNKGLMQIQYNVQNLPVSIDKTDGKRLEYLYDANGIKKRQVYIQERQEAEEKVESASETTAPPSPSASLTTTDFAGNFVYVNNLPAWVNFPDGRVVYNIDGSIFAENYITDHLGNVRVAYTVNSAGTAIVTRQVDNYYPFGMNIRELTASLSGSTRPNEYLYNGKMFQDEMGLNWLDYETRQFDPQIARYTTVDDHAENYYPISPYAYCANNPILFIDPTGEDLYLFYYTTGNKDPEMDKAALMAALTRALDVVNSDEYSDKDDHIVIKGISDLGTLGDNVKEDVDTWGGDKGFGKTKEFGIWSHGAFQGPAGSSPTSQGAASPGGNQLSSEAWGNINFNWVDEGAKAVFYGCRTGKDPDDKKNPEHGDPFVQTISRNENMKNVDVWGQTQRSWPSPYTNARHSTSDIVAGNHHMPTYFVGSVKNAIVGFNSRLGPTYAYPMAVYKNGQFIGFKYQPGKKL